MLVTSNYWYHLWVSKPIVIRYKSIIQENMNISSLKKDEAALIHAAAKGSTSVIHTWYQLLLKLL